MNIANTTFYNHPVLKKSVQFLPNYFNLIFRYFFLFFFNNLLNLFSLAILSSFSFFQLFTLYQKFSTLMWISNDKFSDVPYKFFEHSPNLVTGHPFLRSPVPLNLYYRRRGNGVVASAQMHAGKSRYRGRTLDGAFIRGSRGRTLD